MVLLVTKRVKKENGFYKDDPPAHKGGQNNFALQAFEHAFVEIILVVTRVNEHVRPWITWLLCARVTEIAGPSLLVQTRARGASGILSATCLGTNVSLTVTLNPKPHMLIPDISALCVQLSSIIWAHLPLRGLGFRV